MAIRIGFNPNGATSSAAYIVKALTDQYENKARPNLYGAAAGHCPRANFLVAQSHDTIGVTTPQSSLYMGIGNGIEEALVNGMTRMNILFGENVYLPVRCRACAR